MASISEHERQRQQRAEFYRYYLELRSPATLLGLYLGAPRVGLLGIAEIDVKERECADTIALTGSFLGAEKKLRRVKRDLARLVREGVMAREGDVFLAPEAARHAHAV